jgi:hypothetical protein
MTFLYFRQIHPVSEKGETVKYSPHPPPHTHSQCHQVHSLNSNNTKKSSTLPHNNGPEEGGAHPFIRVNSGRIELVSSRRESPGAVRVQSQHPNLARGGQSHPINENTVLTEKLRRLRNDTRHSWCGSAFRVSSRSLSLPTLRDTII